MADPRTAARAADAGSGGAGAAQAGVAAQSDPGSQASSAGGPPAAAGQRAPRGWTALGTRLPSGLCYAACRLANAKQKLDGGQQLRIAIVQFLTQGRNSTCPNDHAGHSLLALFVAPIMFRQVHAGRECIEANWPF